MNPLTLVKRIQKINSTEAALGISEEASWHAKYKDSAYVYVGGLPFDLTEGDLLAVFAQYGEIVDVNLVRDKGTGKSRGFAFLAYEDQRSTILAVDNLNGAKLLGRIVRVDHVSNYKKKEEEEDEEKEKQKREARGVCRAFQRGDCNRGAGCKFSHDEQRSANTGWGAQDSNARWGHDMHEDPWKSRRRPTHTASSQALEHHQVKEGGEAKYKPGDRDGHSSRTDEGYVKGHPKKHKEQSWKDEDRQRNETDKYTKEMSPKEDQERRGNEKHSRKHKTELNQEDERGSEKRLRRDRDSFSGDGGQHRSARR